MTLHTRRHPLLFRLLTGLVRMRFGHRLRTVRNPRAFLVLFAALSGSFSLATITATAFLTDLPLLFPPLAASSFILFYGPLSQSACPRSVVMAHAVALLSGLCSLLLMVTIFPSIDVANPDVMSWPRVAAITLAMAILSAAMLTFNFAHPPAAATATIAALGFVENAAQGVGCVVATLLLVALAYILNRILGGLPYPLWRHDPHGAEEYEELTGQPVIKRSYWDQLATSMMQRRTRHRP